jgi:hypothetical protein
MKKTNRKKHTKTNETNETTETTKKTKTIKSNSLTKFAGTSVSCDISDEQRQLDNLLIEADKITLDDLEFDKILNEEKTILCDIRKILKKESGLPVDLSVCNKTDSAKSTQHAEKLVTQLKKHKNMSRQKVILGKDDIILSRNTPPIRNYIILRKKNKPINKGSKKTKTL